MSIKFLNIFSLPNKFLKRNNFIEKWKRRLYKKSLIKRIKLKQFFPSSGITHCTFPEGNSLR